jgi:hypothetical protein
MNILEQTEALKDLPDQALIQQMQMPTGEIAPIFITSELKRRKRMRDDYARREAADTPTVAEEVVMAAGMPQGGIADAARALAPKTNMGQNTGMADMMPRAATQAPQRMASGGIVGMRQGGKLVKVMGANFYAFSDGEVYVENPDGSREAVTDPRVLGVIRQQANVGPERQEGTASLGSEILADASPQAPGLESVLSSDRPFSPLSTEVIDTRPAVPSSLGMGGERPSTLTDVTQPTALSEMEKARLATEFTQQQELARAIRDQQEQGIASLNPSLEDARGREFGPLQPEQFSSMNMVPSFDVGELKTLADPEVIPASEQLPTRPRYIDPTYSETAYPMFSESTYEQGLESTPDTGEMQRPALPTIGSDPRISGNTEVGILPRGFQDLRSPQEVDLDLVSDASSAPAKPTDTAGLMKLLQEQMTAKTGPSVGDNIGGPMGEAAAALAAMSSAPAKESNIPKAVSDLGLKPITRNGEEYFISPAGMVFKQEGDELVPVAGGEAMQTVEVAQDLGVDLSGPSWGQYGSYAVDPVTGEVDKSRFTPFKVDISGAKTPQFLTDALGPGSTVSDFLNVQEGAAPVTKEDETKTRVAPASPAEDVVGFGTQPGYDDYPMPAPITMSEKEAVGIEAARPKLRPQGVAPVAGDTTTPAAPDAGGITTVSTKAINDTAKSTGLGVDAWLAIAKGGAAVAASKNPTLLGALGEGAGVAASSLIAQRASDKAASLKQDQIDATLQAAQIRAAAAGQRGMAPPTGSVLFTAAREDLANARYRLEQLNAAKRSEKKTSAWKLDKVKVEEEITRLQNRINRLMGEGGAPSTGGAGDTKNYDVS